MSETSIEKQIGSKSKSLYLIDIAKFICAIAVVGIHTQVFSCFGETANYYTYGVFFRISVAFFFVCSGYFFFSKLKYKNDKIQKCTENGVKLRSYLKRIVILYVIWSVIYFALQFLQWTKNPDISFFHLIISFATSFVIAGSYYHLWYVLCLIYSVPIIYFLLRKFSFKIVSVIAVLLYIIHLIINLSSINGGLPMVSLVGKLSVIPGAIGQTLFLAIPLITIGGYLSKLKFSVSKIPLAIINITSMILLMVESSLIYFLSGKTDYSSYIIFTFVIAVVGFMLLKQINFPVKNPNTFYILRNVSTLIYCVHPLIIKIFKIFISPENVNSILWFVVITIVSIVVSYALILLSKKLKFLKYIF